eukprot:Protomagalhaensia_wolfi_Nauph_80__3132@NODE_3198_length_860_cov_10_546894_g2506_i0_p2_GENE_NODE_3198_length_860_cov_10_546894_g2506_i0NODE_3198_length_860_cov_10_546894_g2506_i0_p2_ORF_typecomplete_len166_score1_15_NODE_3198_length_860_cov_10_546894_g2506_i0185682
MSIFQPTNGPPGNFFFTPSMRSIVPTDQNSRASSTLVSGSLLLSAVNPMPLGLSEESLRFWETTIREGVKDDNRKLLRTTLQALHNEARLLGRLEGRMSRSLDLGVVEVTKEQPSWSSFLCSIMDLILNGYIIITATGLALSCFVWVSRHWQEYRNRRRSNRESS